MAVPLVRTNCSFVCIGNEVAMKLSRIALALVLSLCLMPLAGCGGTDGGSPAEGDTTQKEEDVILTEDDVIDEQDATDEEESEAEDDATATTAEGQRVGEDGIGYVTIPDTWVEFRDIDGNTSLQWNDGTPYTVISLNTFDISHMSEEDQAEFDVTDAANSVYNNILNGGEVSEEDIEGARVTLAGREALQVYAAYPKGSFLTTWCLADDEGVIHYVAAEGTFDTFLDCISIVEETYSFEK